MARLNRDEIVAHLEARGLRFRTITLDTEGEYLPTDVDWNNKDVLHLNHLHTLVKDVTCVVDRDLQASISFQKAFGIPFPLVLVHHDSGPNLQTHFVTLLAWTIVTQHEFVVVTPTRTRAITSYAVGGNRFWMAFFPLIRWVVRRNYRQLMTEDVPLRERRGVLRSWGHTFRGDGASRDIRASLAIQADNVLSPPEADGPVTFPSLPLSDIPDDGWAFLGRTDHLGLKLRREGDRIVAYPRMCPHEGADMDAVPVDDGCLVCPWHGRRLTPVVSIDAGATESPKGGHGHVLRIEDGRLHVTVDPGPRRGASGPSVGAPPATA